MSPTQQAGSAFSPGANLHHAVSRMRTAWSIAQRALFLAGPGLILSLLLVPQLGLNVLWNGLIPLAPALVVIAPGAWRNVCPMASISLLPHKLGLSQRRKPSKQTSARFFALASAALFVIVPLRHTVFDNNADATACLLIAASLMAFALGLRFDMRSAWCNALCPIHPVERLYGQAPAFAPANMRCPSCSGCSSPCPDSSRLSNPVQAFTTAPGNIAIHLVTGGLPGLIWGWYRVPDFIPPIPFETLVTAFAWPLGCSIVTLLLYGLLHRLQAGRERSVNRLPRLFATLAVCTYYWYRIPALAGMGPQPDSGVLCDLSLILPDLPLYSHIATSGFFVWFLLLRSSEPRSWLARPVHA